jgi:hypothetical protein
MAGIKGMPTPSEADLSSPIPNEIDWSQLEAPAPGRALANVKAGGDGIDWSQLDSMEPASAQPLGADPSALPDASLPQEETGLVLSDEAAPTGWASAKEQVREAALRLKNAFTVTDKESVDVLKQSGMFEDVRRSKDGVLVKRPGRKGWEKFDREKLELLGDTVDFARDAFEVVVENAFRAGGVAAGTIAAPGAGTLAGAAGAGAAGAVAAKNAGDVVAQNLLGIPKDPERSMPVENALAATFGAGFTMLGSTIARRTAAAAARGEMKKSVEHAVKRIADTNEDIATVQASGIKLGTDGKFRMDPQQAIGAGQLPEIDATAKELSTEQSFRNFRKQISESVTGAYDSVAKMLGAQAGKGADIGEDFVVSAKDIRNVEGKLIGSFRRLADEKLAGAPQVAPRTLQTVQMMKQSFADPRTGKMTLDAIVQNNPGLTDSQARVIMNEVTSVERQLAKGSMTIDAANALRERLSTTLTKGYNTAAGRPYAVALKDLSDAVRDDHMDMMEKVLKPQDLAVYQASKARYREIMGATKQLGGLLENENISRNELVGKLFEGKGSYKNAIAAKTLINETNPKLWDSMAADYFGKLRNDATDPVTNSVNWGQMTKKWGNLDERLQQELLQSTGIPKDGMNALLKLGIRVQGADFPAMARESQKAGVKQLVKSAFILWGGGATAKGGAAGNLIEGMGKDQALAKWLKDGGMEEILQEMPGLKQTKVQALRDWAARFTPRQAAPTASAMSRRAAEDEKR